MIPVKTSNDDKTVFHGSTELDEITALKIFFPRLYIILSKRFFKGVLNFFERNHNDSPNIRIFTIIIHYLVLTDHVYHCS